MNLDILRNMIRQGESGRLEFKRSFQNDGIQSVVAFANSEGGSVVVGVDNNGAPFGTTFGRETLPKILNKIAGATEPTQIPLMSFASWNWSKMMPQLGLRFSCLANDLSRH